MQAYEQNNLTVTIPLWSPVWNDADQCYYPKRPHNCSGFERLQIRLSATKVDGMIAIINAELRRQLERSVLAFKDSIVSHIEHGPMPSDAEQWRLAGLIAKDAFARMKGADHV